MSVGTRFALVRGGIHRVGMLGVALLAAAALMTATGAARAGMVDFYDDWLGLQELDHVNKSRTVFPAWAPEVGAAMRQETRAFVQNVLWKADGRLQTLLGAPYGCAIPTIPDLL